MSTLTFLPSPMGVEVVVGRVDAAADERSGETVIGHLNRIMAALPVPAAFESALSVVRSVPFLAYRCLFVAALGGCVGFLYELRRGLIKNDRMLRKWCLETAGGAMVGGLLGYYLFRGNVVLTFAVGIGWSGTVGAIRLRVTKIVEAALSTEAKK